MLTNEVLYLGSLAPPAERLQVIVITGVLLDLDRGDGFVFI